MTYINNELYVSEVKVGKELPAIELIDFQNEKIKLPSKYKVRFFPMLDANVISEISNNSEKIIYITTELNHHLQQFTNKINKNTKIISDSSHKICKMFGVLEENGVALKSEFLIEKNIIRYMQIEK